MDVIEEQTDRSGIILPLLTLIILIIFIAWIFYLLYSSSFKVNTVPVTSDANDIILTNDVSSLKINCLLGQCATDILTGIKTCPNKNDYITIDPAFEVCNSKYSCDNPVTPYALQLDGSTDPFGVCPPNVACSCLSQLQCPEYVLSAFTSADGDPYIQSATGQRLYFPQISSAPPIQYSNIINNFCLAPVSWITLSQPGCNFLYGNISLQGISLCMGMSNGCSGLEGSPCKQGTLAFISDDPSNITEETYTSYQIGCVAGTPCPCGQISVYDTNAGQIVCRNVKTNFFA